MTRKAGAKKQAVLIDLSPTLELLESVPVVEPEAFGGNGWTDDDGVHHPWTAHVRYIGNRGYRKSQQALLSRKSAFMQAMVVASRSEGKAKQDSNALAEKAAQMLIEQGKGVEIMAEAEEGLSKSIAEHLVKTFDNLRSGGKELKYTWEVGVALFDMTEPIPSDHSEVYENEDGIEFKLDIEKGTALGAAWLQLLQFRAANLSLFREAAAKN